MFVIRCLLVSTVYVSFKRGGCSGMRRARFAISAAFLARGGLAINLCYTHHICGVSWCRGCRVFRVLTVLGFWLWLFAP